MATWQAGDLIANGIRLHYTRTGGAKPPLVLAHGVTDDGLCWTPVAQALEADYDLIMVDARGHGCSEASETGYDPATQAADLAGLISALGLRRPAVLGHSMGAVTTLVLAGTYPDLPGAILLEDPPGWWMPPPTKPLPDAAERLAGVQAWFSGLRSKTRAELIAEQRAATPGWSATELEPWADSKLRVSPQVLQVFTGAPGTTVDWQRVLPRITCPVLLISADTDQGALLGQDGIATLRTLVPQLRVEPIAAAGHSVRRDQLNRYLTVVQAFLREEVTIAPPAIPERSMLPRIRICYCTQCNWLLRAAWMAQELLSTFAFEVQEVALCPGTGGIFEIHIDQARVWSRAEQGRFPDIKELKQLVRDQIAPDKDLGHTDRHSSR